MVYPAKMITRQAWNVGPKGDPNSDETKSLGMNLNNRLDVWQVITLKVAVNENYRVVLPRHLH